MASAEWGELCLRSMLERHKDHLSVVALNDLADLKTNAHLFQYDSSYSPFTPRNRHGEAHCDAYAYVRFVVPAGLYRIYLAGAKCAAGYKRGSVHLLLLLVIFSMPIPKFEFPEKVF
jgi:hypothetical protein